MALVRGRVAATTPGADPDKLPYPENVEPGKPGTYFAKPDETCHKIAKMFGVDLDLLVQINKKRYPTLLSSSKLKKDTCIELPPPDMRWILTKQISKTKPEGKKKRIYSVQVCVLGSGRSHLCLGAFFCPCPPHTTRLERWGREAHGVLKSAVCACLWHEHRISSRRTRCTTISRASAFRSTRSCLTSTVRTRSFARCTPTRPCMGQPPPPTTLTGSRSSTQPSSCASSQTPTLPRYPAPVAH